MSAVPPPSEPLSEAGSQSANRGDWDRTADEYQSEHGEFLGDVGFVWSPEGLDEADVALLGDLSGRAVLEIGCGAAQCARWLRDHGARAVGIDLSEQQLRHAARIDEATGIAVPVACATATALPIADASFDLACSAFGALPFIGDIDTAMREVARVLRPGGRWVLSVTHPVRWMFPDDPTKQGLRVVRSYFDHSPYVEYDNNGAPSYVEHHHTMSDWIGSLTGAGFVLERLIEPEWPDGLDRDWGGWGRERGAYLPGTAVFVATR